MGQPSSMDRSMSATIAAATLYVFSGVAQPLLMTVLKDAGLADPTCQLYMVFYYLGPALVVLTLFDQPQESWPSIPIILKSSSIAVIDILAQAMNYTGAAMAGPTIFAIIYSSVTVWTALFSTIFLKRNINVFQWLGVATVFGGLVITALDSVSVGVEVFHGACLVIGGSLMHALTYVLSEGIMTKREKLPVRINCAVQGIVAFTAFFLWQIVYTRPRFHELIQSPMQDANTTFMKAAVILTAIGVFNLIHALTFFHTLKNFPGGATSAGVMKGLQAVLVFLATSWLFCNRTGGSEMCFTRLKLMSLVTVIGGVFIFGKATKRQEDGSLNATKVDYTRIVNQGDITV